MLINGWKRKEKTITSLFFITEKSNGTLKARQSADGRKQREYMLKEELTSPTVTTEVIFITSVYDTKKRSCSSGYARSPFAC